MPNVYCGEVANGTLQLRIDGFDQHHRCVVLFEI